MDNTLKRTFENKRLVYVRNYNNYLDLPWQEVFKTDERKNVEKYCTENDISFEWIGEDHLRTMEYCDAIVHHPISKETVWFNQAHLFHVSSLEKTVRENLLETFSEKNIPRNVYFADGEPIPESDLNQIRNIYQTNKLIFSWKQGDVLLLDNLLVGHGRQPFKGARKVRVAMTN